LTKFNGEIKLFLNKNGNKERIDQKMQDGLRVVNGRTCIGVRDLVNAIEGAEVNWDGTNKIVDITYNGKNISYPLNKPVMWDGDKMVTIDVPAQVDPSIERTFLPIRNIAETLGFKVDWNQKTKEVTLTPGAGTTATQTTTKTNANKEGTWENRPNTYRLSSGVQLPDYNNLPKGNNYYFLSEKDWEDNGDFTQTFARGTKWEATIPKIATKADSAPINPDFKILGENKGDERYKYWIIGEGDPSWEFMYNKFDKGWFEVGGKKLYRDDPGIANYIDTDEGRQKILKLMKEREIKQEYIDDFFNRYKYIKGVTDTSESSVKFNTPAKGEKFYDMTGVFEIKAWEVYDKGYYYLGGSLIGMDSYLLTTEGDLFRRVAYLKTGKTYEIDKIISYIHMGGKRHWFVIDVPNFKITPRRPDSSKQAVIVNTYYVISANKQ
ncbi:MAG: copper amine oxidase N-terminal domain-containing protein, partial [Ezakiella sp.]|nr:copper amine oxidase N-terminal domain-containing protein [Ezakiella sp.]